MLSGGQTVASNLWQRSVQADHGCAVIAVDVRRDVVGSCRLPHDHRASSVARGPLPKSDMPAPKIGQYGLARIRAATRRTVDLRVYGRGGRI